MNSKTRNIFERLCKEAQTRRIVGSPDKYRIENCIIKGETIPDYLLPGRFLINNCSLEERIQLQKLSSNDTSKYRPMPWAFKDDFTGVPYG